VPQTGFRRPPPRPPRTERRYASYAQPSPKAPPDRVRPPAKAPKPTEAAEETRKKAREKARNKVSYARTMDDHEVDELVHRLFDHLVPLLKNEIVHDRGAQRPADATRATDRPVESTSRRRNQRRRAPEHQAQRKGRPPMSSGLDPGSTIFFTLSIDGDDLGFFNGCEGLGSRVEVEQYQEGGNNGFVWQLPSRVTFSNIRLTRR